MEMMSWHTDVTGHGAGNPETRSEGTGTLRVDNVQPVPLPQRTLPVTRAGFATRDNHYLYPNPGKPVPAVRVRVIREWGSG